MKLQILQENLKKALTSASHITSNKAQLPVLGNVYLSAKETKLTVASTNLELSISISQSAKITEEGEITVPAKTITEIVSNLSNETVSLESDKEVLNITSETFHSSLSGMNASDFPAVPHTTGEKDLVIIDKEKLSSALSQVVFSVSQDETRPVLTGVLFIFKEGNLTLVSTDGFRLSKIIIPAEFSSDVTFVLPKNTVLELLRLMGEEEKIKLAFKKENNQVIFELGDTILSSRILEGDFPPYEKIIPSENLIKITADKDDVLRSVKLASVFARESANIVKIKVSQNYMEFNAESQNSGNENNQVEMKLDNLTSVKEKDGFEIAFNYKFLEDFLNVLKEEDIVMEFSNSNAPGVFTNPKEQNYLHLIMPVKIQP